MKFKDSKHEEMYVAFLAKMKWKDEYHRAAAYLLALDSVLRNHVADVFDFSEDCIKPETALAHGWQTGTSRCTTRLMMNLWNGYSGAGEDDLADRYSVNWIFGSAGEYIPFYFEAIKLRYMG